MSELRTIVDRLNGHPFNKDLTLVAFDELSPFELLQLVNEVLTHLDDRHGIDLRDEEPSVTAARWIEFLSILKYTILGIIWTLFFFLWPFSVKNMTIS